jgi:hypothetical protein
MKTSKILLLLIFLTGISGIAQSQDMIIKMNADTLKCKIREIGSDEIKYALPEYSDEVLFTITKEKIDKLVFKNGKEMTFEDEMNNPLNYEDQNKNAIKIDFLSPLTGNTTFAFERSLKPGQSIEATLGIIGLGADPNDYNPRGSFVKFGMKFIKSPDFYLKGLRYAHVLKGAYVKPEIGFGYHSKETEVYDYYDFDDYPHYYTERKDYFSMIAQIIIGKQWVVNDIFLVDFYGGVGYGFDGGEGEYHYGYAITPDVPLSFSAGLKIGILF